MSSGDFEERQAATAGPGVRSVDRLEGRRAGGDPGAALPRRGRLLCHLRRGGVAIPPVPGSVAVRCAQGGKPAHRDAGGKATLAVLPRLADSPVRVPAGQRRCYFPQARRREWTYHSCHPGGGHGDYFDPHRRHTGFLYNNETGAVKCPGVADFYADTYQEARSLLRLLGKDPGGGLRLTPACIVAGMSDDLARYAPPDIPLRLTRTGPGSRADMIEYVRTVIEQRTAVNDDTSADGHDIEAGHARPWWWESTARAWLASRPGKGWRGA
jgi:hypothetical protein